MRIQMLIVGLCIVLAAALEVGFGGHLRTAVEQINCKAEDCGNQLTVREFTSALEVNPEDAGALSGRAEALNARGEYRCALTDIDRAIQLAPKVRFNYVIRAQSLSGLGMAKLALKDCHKAVGTNPTDYCYWCSSWIRGIAGDERGAILDLDKAVELEPRNAHYYWCRMRLRSSIGDVSGSFKDYHKYAELDSKSSLGRKVLANFLLSFAGK